MKDSQQIQGRTRWTVATSTRGTCFDTEPFEGIAEASEYAAECALHDVHDFAGWAMTLRDAVEQVRETHPSTFVRAMLRYAARDADAAVARGEYQFVDAALLMCLASRLAIAANSGPVSIDTNGAKVDISRVRA